MRTRSSMTLATFVVAVFILQGCMHQDGEGGDDAELVRMVSGNQFEPAELEIPAGTTVLWRNTDNIGHTSTANPVLVDDADEWGSELLDSGDEFPQTFDEPGEYPYYCVPHATIDQETGECTGMCGTITVTGDGDGDAGNTTS